MNSQKLPLQFDSASFKLRPHTCKISRNQGAHLKTKKNKNIESLIIYTHDNNTHTHTPPTRPERTNPTSCQLYHVLPLLHAVPHQIMRKASLYPEK